MAIASSDYLEGMASRRAVPTPRGARAEIYPRGLLLASYFPMAWSATRLEMLRVSWLSIMGWLSTRDE